MDSIDDSIDNSIDKSTNPVYTDNSQLSYRFEQTIYESGILDKTVDATYIIHLECNGRLENIQTQLSEYHLSKIVYILFNKGYKNCKKSDRITSPALDIIDAYLHIFKHAQTANYNNILILEDDFMFDAKINNSAHYTIINQFLDKHQHTDFLYYLGYSNIPLS